MVARQWRHRPKNDLWARRGLTLSNDLWSALALMLVFEGLMPLLAPGAWRAAFEKALQLTDGQLRFFGLACLLLGLSVLALLQS